MAKKPRVRTLMHSQYVKVSERMLKSGRQYFCNIFWSLWNETRTKKSVLVIGHLETVRWHIDIWRQVFSLSKSQILTHTNSNAIISKSKNIFSVFFLHFRNLHKIGILWNKNESQRLFLSGIKDWKMWGYLNALKAPSQNAYGQSTC